MKNVAILLLIPLLLPPPLAVWPISRLWPLYCSSSSHSNLLQLCHFFLLNNLVASFHTYSSYLLTGFPACLLPPGLHFQNVLGFYFRTSLHLLAFIYITRSMSSWSMYRSALYHFHQMPLTRTGPNIPWRSFLWKEPIVRAALCEIMCVCHSHTEKLVEWVFCFVTFTCITNLDGTKIRVKYWQVWCCLWIRMLDKSQQTAGICHCFLPSIFPISDCKYLISYRYLFRDSYLVFPDGSFTCRSMSVLQNIHKLQQYISLKPAYGHSCISYNNIKTTNSYMLWDLLAHHQGVQ